LSRERLPWVDGRPPPVLGGNVTFARITAQLTRIFAHHRFGAQSRGDAQKIAIPARTAALASPGGEVHAHASQERDHSISRNNAADGLALDRRNMPDLERDLVATSTRGS
jgi:hypothetical protein